jgi:alkanesulfonate monooxygenase SsuD/methylene tetrahydromethanopterin reductase-like flavin-dependent oxidoreductase (luciferase family)
VNGEAAADAARRGVNVVSTLGNAALKPLVERYFESWRGEAGAVAPLVGAQRHVCVAETDAEAMAIARPAYKAWYDSLTSLWRSFNTVPMRFAESLERAIAGDAAIVGSPETVRVELERHLTETRCTYFVGRFAFGTLAHEDASRSLALFAREVMPHFRTV